MRPALSPYIDGMPDGASQRRWPHHGHLSPRLLCQRRLPRSLSCRLGCRRKRSRFEDTIEQTLDALARHLETHLDLDRILALAEPVMMMWPCPAFARPPLPSRRAHCSAIRTRSTAGSAIRSNGWAGSSTGSTRGLNNPGRAVREREGRVCAAACLGAPADRLLHSGLVYSHGCSGRCTWRLDRSKAVIATAFIAQKSLREHVTAVPIAASTVSLRRRPPRGCRHRRPRSQPA